MSSFVLLLGWTGCGEAPPSSEQDSVSTPEDPSDSEHSSDGGETKDDPVDEPEDDPVDETKDDPVETNTCEEGSLRASSTTCGLNGRGLFAEECIEQQWSISGRCEDLDICQDQTSQPGLTACGFNGNGYVDQVCELGFWEDSSECEDPDLCKNDQVDVGQTACGFNQNGVLERLCTSGQWLNTGNCLQTEICENSETPIPGETPCGFNRSGALTKTCVLGTWVDTASCVEVDLCEDGTIQSVGETACGNNDSGLLEMVCTSGAWQDSSNCLGADSCQNGGTQFSGASCDSTEAKHYVENCELGVWVVDTAICVEPCTEGDAPREGSTPCGYNGAGMFMEECLAGIWTQATCSDPDECVIDEALSSACGPNDEGTLDQTCPSGQLIGTCITCGNGTCTASESCDSCETDCGICPISTTIQVDRSSDDAEEDIPTGDVNLSSTDLELAEDTQLSRNQLVGMRFNLVDVPPRATITEAHLELTIDSTTRDAAGSLNLEGQATDDALTFTSDNDNISLRSRTVAKVAWTPADWGQAPDVMNSPDISSIIQELVDRPGWRLGNSLVLFVSGTGTREVDSFDGAPASAPRLVIDYTEQPVVCGDGWCSPTEDCISCDSDCGACPSCGDGTCDAGECGGCTADCGECLSIAMIGDYGYSSNPNAGTVADMVANWQPNHVITAGDNNYDYGESSTIDANIGQFYADFIGNYTGTYGSGSPTNRFWPSPGNHDWASPDGNLEPYLAYFTLPTGSGTERYYEIDLGLMHLFAIDSDPNEPDGISSASAQAGWLQNAMASADSCFNFVIMHHAPYSSGEHKSAPTLRWPYASWGADAVFAGHDHHYERFEIDDNAQVPYFVNGLGGRSLRQIPTANILAESLVRYRDNYGAMLITIEDGAEPDTKNATYEFYSIANGGTLIDSYTVSKSCP